MDPKTKTKIRIAVKDYFRLFPEDWESVKIDIEYQRQNLADEMAMVKGSHSLKRALFTVPEKLSAMIGKKLNDEERQAFTQLDNARWFAKEFAQFRLTKEV